MSKSYYKNHAECNINREHDGKFSIPGQAVGKWNEVQQRTGYPLAEIKPYSSPAYFAKEIACTYQISFPPQRRHNGKQRIQKVDNIRREFHLLHTMANIPTTIACNPFHQKHIKNDKNQHTACPSDL